MLQIPTLPTVTRMVGVSVTILATVLGFDVTDLKIPAVTRIATVQIMFHSSVIIVNVADQKSASSHKDGGCPDHDLCKCHRLLMLQIATVPTVKGWWVPWSHSMRMSLFSMSHSIQMSLLSMLLISKPGHSERWFLSPITHATRGKSKPRRPQQGGAKI